MKKILLLCENLLGNSGGAESYGAHMAQVLNSKYDVTIVCKNGFVDLDTVKKRYNLTDIKIRTVRVKDGKNKIERVLSRVTFRNKIKEILREADYSMFINTNSNRLIGFNNIASVHLIHFPKPNFCHYFPKKIGDRINARYKNSYALFLVNSNFTKNWIKKYWSIDAKVLYPPIYTQPIKSLEEKKSENIILMVGRITEIKKIREAVKIFCSGVGAKHPEYSLHIIGNTDKNEISYFNEIRELAKDNNVYIHSDVDYNTLISWYQKAKIFWHFAGYMIDENQDPENTEHFGMTTVEAMTQGCVPIVINKAGQKESVKDGYNGFRWDSVEELNEKTEMLINNDLLLNEMAGKALSESKKFTVDEFQKNCFQYIDSILLGGRNGEF